MTITSLHYYVTFIRKNIRGFFAVLIEPFSLHEDDRRRERILNIILIGSITMLALLDAIVLYYSWSQGDQYQEVSFALFSSILAFFVVLYAISRRGWFLISSYLLIVSYFISISYAAYRWGVNLPSALLGYALLITIASILISAQFGFIVAGIISLFIIVLWHYQFYGVLPPIQPSVPNNSDALVFAILFGLITTIAWLSNREIERSLHRARVSERELKEERDLLEVKVEERTRELRNAQLEKMDALYRFAEFGQLASGLFHDLTSVLQATLLHGETQERIEVKHGTRSSVDDAVIAQREINLFVEAVRKQLHHETVSELFSFADSIERAMQLVQHRCHVEHIKLVFEHDEFIPEYFGNAGKFHQVVINLLINAIDAFATIDYIPNVTRMIMVKLYTEENAVSLVVEDNGCGMTAEVQENIFEPFFTTKHGTKGIGIGFAITRRIVENDFGGTIRVCSKAGEGTRFTVSFPLSGGSKKHHEENDISSNDSGSDSEWRRGDQGASIA